MCEYLRTTFLRRLRLTLCEHGVGREGHGYKCTSSKRRMASSLVLALPESRATRQRFNIVLDHDSAAGTYRARTPRAWASHERRSRIGNALSLDSRLNFWLYNTSISTQTGPHPDSRPNLVRSGIQILVV